MKNKFFLIAMLFLASNYAYAQFVPKGTSTEPIEGIQLTYGISVVNEDVVWGVYFPVTSPITTPTSFTRTTDGGATWTGGTIPTGDSTLIALSIYAKDELTAWVGMNSAPAQNYGKTYKTIDGGQTWQEQPVFDGTLINSFHFWTELEGIAFGVTGAKDNFRVLLTKDGGLTWTPRYALSTQVGESTWIGNSNHFYEVIGDHVWMGTTLGRLLHSADRGNTWEAIDLNVPKGNTLNSIAFQDETTGIVISSTSDIGIPKNGFGYRTADGGKTWVRTVLPESLQSIDHVPGSNGVYIGVLATSGPNPNYLISYDGGYEWETVQSPPFVTLQFLSPEVGWAGSFVEAGGMYKWEGEPLMAKERKRTIPAIDASWFDDAVGQSFSYHFTVGDFDPGPSGENIVWDFSDLTAEFFRGSGAFVSREEVYGGEEEDFPEGTHFINFDDESSAIFNVTPEKADYLGARGSFNNTLDMPTLAYPFPYTLGTTVDNNNVYSINGGPKTYEAESIIVDAYGTLKMPQGDLENVLRTTLTRITKDSSQIDSTGVITTIDVYYLWYTSEYYGEPLLVFKSYQAIEGDTTLTFSAASMDLKVVPPNQRAAENVLLEGTLNEDFDNGIPATWQLNNSWQVDSATVLSTRNLPIPATAGTVAAITDDFTITKSRLISPAIALATDKGYQLSFDSYFLKGNFGGAFPESATVQISSNDQANWTTIYEMDATTDWENITIDIHPSFSGWTVNFAFLYDDEGYDNPGWAVDNVVLKEFADNDKDGFGENIDCDDEDAAANPGAEEVANNDIDEDCDGIALIIDEDGDGFNSDEDCDDNNAAINGDAKDIVNNGIDEDCDGVDFNSCVHAPIVSMEQVSCTQFKISWFGMDATNFVRLRAVGDAEWYIVDNWPHSNITFNNLAACTDYEVQVASFCENGSGGVLSAPLNITTAGCETNECTGYDHTNSFVGQSISAKAAGNPTLKVLTKQSLSSINSPTLNNIQLAANPVSDQLSVLWDAEVVHPYTMQLFDMTGRQIQQIQATTGGWTHQDVTGLSSGVYILRVVHGNVAKTFKIVKQ